MLKSMANAPIRNCDQPSLIYKLFYLEGQTFTLHKYKHLRKNFPTVSLFPQGVVREESPTTSKLSCSTCSVGIA